MEATLDDALDRIFGGDGGLQLTPDPDEPLINPDGSQTTAQQARSAWFKAKSAAESGDWATYGEEINRLGQILEAMTTSDGSATTPDEADAPNPEPSAPATAE